MDEMSRFTQLKILKTAPSLKNINEGAVPSRNLFREGTAGQYFFLMKKGMRVQV
jgi:hypothetical protein